MEGSPPACVTTPPNSVLDETSCMPGSLTQVEGTVVVTCATIAYWSATQRLVVLDRSLRVISQTAIPYSVSLVVPLPDAGNGSFVVVGLHSSYVSLDSFSGCTLMVDLRNAATLLSTTAVGDIPLNFDVDVQPKITGYVSGKRIFIMVAQDSLIFYAVVDMQRVPWTPRTQTISASGAGAALASTQGGAFTLLCWSYYDEVQCALYENGTAKKRAWSYPNHLAVVSTILPLKDGFLVLGCDLQSSVQGCLMNLTLLQQSGSLTNATSCFTVNDIAPQECPFGGAFVPSLLLDNQSWALAYRASGQVYVGVFDGRRMVARHVVANASVAPERVVLQRLPQGAFGVLVQLSYVDSAALSFHVYHPDATATPSYKRSASDTATPTRSAFLTRSVSHANATATKSYVPTSSRSLTSTAFAVNSHRVDVLNDKLPPTVAKSIKATGVASVALSTAVVPSAAGQQARVGFALSMLDCGNANDDGPDAFEHPLVVVGISINSHDAVTSDYITSVIHTTVIFCILPIALFEGLQVLRGRAQRFLSSCVAFTLSYFLPVILKAVFIVAFRGPTPEQVAASILCGFCVAVPFFVIVWKLTCAFGATPKKPEGAAETEKSEDDWCWVDAEPASRFVERYGAFFDGSRSPDVIVRASFLEDVIVSCLFGAMDAMSRTSWAPCTALTLTTVALAVLHIAFLVFVRPLRSRWEMSFSVTAAILQLIIVALCVLFVVGQPGWGSAIVDVLAVCVVLTAVVFLVQCAMLFWSLAADAMCNSQRKERHAMDAKDDTTSNPLLSVPPWTSCDVERTVP